jgi:Xaa-Pro dipeptidase
LPGGDFKIKSRPRSVTQNPNTRGDNMPIESKDASPFVYRQARLRENLYRASLDFLALNPGPSLVYLTGLSFHLMERPVVVIFSATGAPSIILPELEAGKLEGLPVQMDAFLYGENPADWQAVFQKAARSANLDGRKIGVEPNRLRYLELHLLEVAAPEASFASAESILESLRIKKDLAEVAAMRKAVEISQEALERTLPVIKIGMTERAIASELIVQLYRGGADAELPFAPIVFGGPNGANPHAVPSDRPLQPGDLLVIDWGASYHGYVADLTRTFAIGDVEDEFARIARIVCEANTAGRLAAGPGVPAEMVDSSARRVIEDAGYGQYFTHRTGHGIGMEGHEAPYIRAGNSLILEPGMAFTVEPGIYLPGRGGVRIEDNVVITEGGADCLSNLPRQLRVLG